MPTADALMGHGLPAQSAEQLGGNPSARGPGIGTAQVGAKTVISKNTELTPTAGNTAYILPNGLFDNFQLYNSAATAVTALVYAPVGHTMNGGASASTPVSIPQNKAAIIWQYKPNFWASVLTA